MNQNIIMLVQHRSLLYKSFLSLSTEFLEKLVTKYCVTTPSAKAQGGVGVRVLTISYHGYHISFHGCFAHLHHISLIHLPNTYMDFAHHDSAPFIVVLDTTTNDLHTNAFRKWASWW